MAQSLSKIYLHIIFSTKKRHPWIVEKIQSELYAYMAAVLKSWDSPVIIIGGMPDHTHILSLLSKNHPVSKVIEQAKKKTSKWIKTKDKEFSNFYWQNGYGVFSVSQSQLGTVRNYIENQKEHHKRMSFKDEYRSFLKKYEIPYDERYVWD
jgi:REP element-mobilizing transposase RayT